MDSYLIASAVARASYCWLAVNVQVALWEERPTAEQVGVMNLGVTPSIVWTPRLRDILTALPPGPLLRARIRRVG